MHGSRHAPALASAEAAAAVASRQLCKAEEAAGRPALRVAGVTCSADRGAVGSMRMSMGPSCRKLNPRSGESICERRRGEVRMMRGC
jgi:hypothetical protein